MIPSIKAFTFTALFLALAFHTRSTHGLYFHLFGTERRCFVEELPKDTMVVGNYKAERWSEEQQRWYEDTTFGIDIHVMVRVEGLFYMACRIDVDV